VMAVLISSPNGELIQVGGYLTYASSDRLWARSVFPLLPPLLLSSRSLVCDIQNVASAMGLRDLSSRRLLSLHLHQIPPRHRAPPSRNLGGVLRDSLRGLARDLLPRQRHHQLHVPFSLPSFPPSASTSSLLPSSSQPPAPSPAPSLSDTKTITPASKTKDAFSSHFTNMTVALSVFGCGILVAVVVGLAFRHRAASSASGGHPAVATRRSKSSSKSRPLAASAENEEDEEAMVPIRRKTKVPSSSSSELTTPQSNENRNPIIEEDSPPSALTTTSSEPEPMWSSLSPPPKSAAAGGQPGGAGGRGMLSSMISVRSNYQNVERVESQE
jgi:hypothetical protein